MTVTYGFYDSLSGDRTYNALQFSSLLDSIINDGVFLSIGDALAVNAGTGLHVTVGIGRAWFDHTWTYNDSVLTLDITTPHAVLDRIDAIVLETNSESATRANSIKVIDGTPAASPVPPTLTHTSTINQYPLAYILVEHNTTQIVQANIQNKIGTSDCPFVTGILQTIDIDLLFAQWQDDFETWFAYLVDQLSGEQVTMLLNLIMTHDHSDPLHTQVVTGGIEDAAITLVKMAVDLRFQKLFEFEADGINQPDWSSIPADFTHLIMIYNGLSSRITAGWDDFWLRINNDSSAHYYTASWRKSSTQDDWNYGITNPHAMGMHCGALSAQNAGYLQSGSGLVLFPNYKRTTLYKTAIHFTFEYGAYGANLIFAHTYWNQTAAINRLTGNMSSTYKPRAGSLFSLYGFN